jgi:hypothetical protein
MAPSAISSKSLAVCGWQRYMYASIANTSAARAASSTAMADARFTAIGFSTRRCLPARAAAIAHLG